jgi:ribosomal-protein-alanine N-acetyltransferase
MADVTVLETGRLFLRHFESGDVEAYQALVTDPEVMQHIPPRRALDTTETGRWVESFAAHVDKHGFGVWILFDRATGEFVGHGGLQRLPTGEVEVIYAIVRARWGEGLATELALASLNYGFETLGLDTIIGLAYPENVASRRVLEKAGMRFTGITSDHFDEELARYEIIAESLGTMAGSAPTPGPGAPAGH